MSMTNNNKEDLTIISYNCDGLNLSTCYIQQLLTDKKPDFLFLQETWLLDSQINLLGNINVNYLFTGISGCESGEMLKGRPYGGVAVLWSKKLSQYVQPVASNSNRITGCKYMFGDEKILFLTVYMPCDSQSVHRVNDEYVNVIQEIENICENNNASRIIIGGDWNTSIDRNNAQTNCFKRFLDTSNFDICWNSMNASKSCTYENINLGHQSCIDHFIMSMNVFDNITNCTIIDSVDNLSCHKPILLQVKCQINRLNRTGKQLYKRKTAWHKVVKEDIDCFKQHLDVQLNRLKVPACINNCTNVSCKDSAHTNAICELCSNLISCLLDADSFLPKSSKRKNVLPYWSEKVRPLRQDSLWWHWLWKECGRPRVGSVASTMRSTRAKYHAMVKYVKNEEKHLRFSRMGESIATDNSRDLFNEVRHANGSFKHISDCVDGCNTPEEITDLFYTKYDNLFHMVPADHAKMSKLRKQIESDVLLDGKINSCFVTTQMVDKAFSSLKCDKTDGDNINTNLLKNSSNTFKSLIVSLFNSMLVHGFTANNLLISTLVSIPKNVRASLTSSDNYRGIALCSNIAKALDRIFLTMFSNKLLTSNAQYAYKEKHGSVLCTLMLKESVKYFTNRNTDVYCCLLDASKAFDCVSYDKLFSLLLKRKIPPLVIRLLLDSYTRQSMNIKWEDCLSTPINVENGVKQGGILSPILFAIYYDVLVSRLKNVNVGCKIGPDVLNTFVYADDVTLIAPSRTALQSLVDVCLAYSEEYNINFNKAKTKCIKFSLLTHNTVNLKRISMYNTDLAWERNVNHLGNCLRNDLSDRDDIKIKLGQFYSQFNKIVANFSSCNRYVLSKLFYTYCNSFYGSQAWDLSKPCIAAVHTAWNKAVRRMLHLPYQTHCNLLSPILGIPHIKEQVACRFLKMFNNMYNSKNALIHNMAVRCMHSSNTGIGNNVLHLSSRFKCSVSGLLSCAGKNVSNLCGNTNMCDGWRMDVARELCEAVSVNDEIVVPGFEVEELRLMLECVCTG